MLSIASDKSRLLRIELMVKNVFDFKNENDVYADTGTATYTTTIPNDRRGEVAEINTFEEFFLYQPNYYSRPREVRVGVTLQF